MNKSELNKLKTQFNKAHKENDILEAEYLADCIIAEMFDKKMYYELAEFAEKKLVNNYNAYWSFNVAFSLNQRNKCEEAKEVYERLLQQNPNNSSSQNNLALIYEKQGNIDKAFVLLQFASKNDPGDKTIKSNYDRLKGKVDERSEQESQYKNAYRLINAETPWAIDKLKSFLSNVKKDSHFTNQQLPISSKQFGWFAKTDGEKAESLRKQWLEKAYILDTGKRGDYGVHIYELNPYLEDILKSYTPIEMPKNWMEKIEHLNAQTLQELKFFEVVSKLSKVKKKYGELLLRDYHELVLNYIFDNRKSVVIMSGSMLETLFMYYCDKKKIDKISFYKEAKKVTVKIKDATINDYLLFFDETKQFNTIVTAIGNVARIYRNMIHPANELMKSGTPINDSKAEICFYAVIEIILEIL